MLVRISDNRAFVTNTASGSVSTYDVANDGSYVAHRRTRSGHG